MIILAIETSCDETAIAILRAQKGPHFEILSNIVASQIKIHRKYGGVYPKLAKREHERNLFFVLKKALKKSKLPSVSKKIQDSKFKTLNSIFKKQPDLLKKAHLFFKKYQKPGIDFIGVTIGPGLEPCLWTGINFAKALALFWNLPIVPVDHIEAHILVNFIENPKISFPAICLVVSGGHTQLILMKDFGNYKIIGETRDDAAGECFDKTARILGLPYPGGPSIAKQASELKNKKYQIINKLPRPMIYSKDYDFSFSGLKTAVFYDFKKRNFKIRKSKKYVREMAHEIQMAINDLLIKKTLRAARDLRVKTIILAGGVAANNDLRKRLKSLCLESKIDFLVPKKELCTDNALMVAISAFFHKDESKPWKEIKAKPDLRIG